MSYAVLFNRLSGRRSARWNRKLIEHLKNQLPEPVAAYDVENPEELVSAMQAILTSDAQSLIISGGDGTLNRTINAFLNHPQTRPLKLGIIPNGTGNSYALDLGITTEEEGIQAVLGGHTLDVDVGQLRTPDTSRFFLNNFGIGLVYDITELAARLRPIGALSYVVATLVKLIRLRTQSVTLTLDGQTSTDETVLFLDVCNSRFTGGDMNMAPDITLTDGHFQLISVPPMSRFKLLTTFPKLFAGTHVHEDFVTSRMVQQVTLKSKQPIRCIVDGDLMQGMPITLKMSSKKLTFYTRN